MAKYKRLITLRGSAPYADDAYTFDVIEGGALQITSRSGNTIDLIGPGYWVAVVDGESTDRLDWNFLAPPETND